MAVTLKTISERVGISQAAVSMILNRRKNDLSSPETREKVFAIARELNYKQKFGHKILRGDKTHSVAIVYAMHRLLLEEQIQNLVLLVFFQSAADRRKCGRK
jgi:DNA-binding LacI/PurR family transcriptional regulator